MKNLSKTIRSIALVALLVFSMAGYLGAQTSLSLNTWAQGSLSGRTSEEWYTVNVTAGTTYYIWVMEYWSDSVKAGDGYADVRLDARYTSRTGTAIFQNSDAGAGTNTNAGGSGNNAYPASNFRASQNGTVYIRVFPDQSMGTYGTFKIAVTTSNSRLAGETNPVAAAPAASGLALNTWVQGSLSGRTSEEWQTINVVAGTTYYIWVMEYWSDSVKAGDGYADVRLDARYTSQTGTAIFQNSDAGAGTNTNAGGSGNNAYPASNFRASQNGTVHIRIFPDQSMNTYGTYKIAVTTSNSRPAGETAAAAPAATGLALNTWVQGSLAGRTSEQWQTLSVTAGTTYYIWVKEYWSDSVKAGEGYADVRLDARYTSQTGTAIFQNSDAGAGTNTNAGGSGNNAYPASNFRASQNGTVHIRIFPDQSMNTYGTYKIAVTTSNSRPAGE